jgi:hypothetical protein
MSADPCRARFGELVRGYESYYLRACRPEGGLGVWIRYTVHRAEGAAPTGSLWFTLFDAEAPGPVAAKVTLPEPTTGERDWILIGDAAIGEGGAEGAIGDVSWELEFTGAAVLRHLSGDWMYKAALPRTKPVSVHPIARFDGTISVRGREIRLEGWPGMVGHNWGTQHAERWIWLHGMGFEGADDGTWLDVVLARIKLAGRTTPWVASGAISVNGSRFALGGPQRIRGTQVVETPERLEFVLPGRGIAVSGTVRAPRERFVGWIYADPDGSEHHAVNCSIADLDLWVSRGDERLVGLSSTGLAAYELGMREHDHGMAIQPYPDGQAAGSPGSAGGV